jgi:hypothetical protein
MFDATGTEACDALRSSTGGEYDGAGGRPCAGWQTQWTVRSWGVMWMPSVRMPCRKSHRPNPNSTEVEAHNTANCDHESECTVWIVLAHMHVSMLRSSSVTFTLDLELHDERVTTRNIKISMDLDPNKASRSVG